VIKEGRSNPEEYLIVGAAEANPREGKISHESPLGRALLGAKPGDKVEVSAPSGAFKVKIVEVK
jgi:transcription elongation factor GreA